MPGIDPVSSVAAVVDDSLKLALQKDAQHNTTPEIAAAIAAEVQKLKDQINSAIEKGDIEAIRRLCA